MDIMGTYARSNFCDPAATKDLNATGKEVWQGEFAIEYNDGTPDCSQTILVNEDPGTNGANGRSEIAARIINNVTQRLSCSVTCNTDVTDCTTHGCVKTRPDGGTITLQYCDGEPTQNWCTGEAVDTCPAVPGRTATGNNGNYCEAWKCGFDCTNPTANTCARHTGSGTGTYTSMSACQTASACMAPTATPVPIKYKISGNLVECILDEAGRYTQQNIGRNIGITITDGDGNQQTRSSSTSYEFTDLFSGSYSVNFSNVTGMRGPYTSCTNTSSANAVVTLGPNAPKSAYYIWTCDGTWSGCSATCGGGTKTLTCGDGTTFSSSCNTQACATAPTATPVPGNHTVSCNHNTKTLTFAGPACSNCVEVFDVTDNQNALLGGNVPGSKSNLTPGHQYRVSINGVVKYDAVCGNNAPTPNPNCGTCNAETPECGGTSNGTCSNNGQPCQLNAPACADNGRFSLRLYDATGTAPYKGTGKINMVVDYHGASDRKHNSLFYGYPKSATHPDGYTGPHSSNGDQLACGSEWGLADWHPYMDPGYQLNTDGTFGACPASNYDETPDWTKDRNHKHHGESGNTITDEHGSCTPSCGEECAECRTYNGRYDDYCGEDSICERWRPASCDCTINGNNEVCVGTEPDPAVFPRCFGPRSSDPITLVGTGTNTTPPSFTQDWSYHCHKSNDGCADNHHPRHQQRTFSIAAPAGYKLKVLKLVPGSGWNRFESGDFVNGGGDVVKDFDTPGPGGNLNHFAIDWQSPDGNTTVLAYDIFVKQNQITGNVYLDNNRNGARDAGEGNYDLGTTINLTGGTTKATSSDGSGNYIFTDVSAGNHSVTLTIPTGYEIMTTNPVAINVNGDMVVNFGISPQFKISGNVYTDYNHNGAKDGEDINYQGATVTAGSTNDLTDASGNYLLENLTTGSYNVTLTEPANYDSSTTNPVPVTLGPDTTANFGITPLYSIAGTVWNDIDKDTIKDGGEVNYSAGTSNITFRNTTTGVTTTTSTTTGVYTSGQTLVSGTYVVSYNSLPQNWEMTYILGTPPSFTVTVGRPGTSISCNSGTHNATACDGSGNISNLHFGITDSIVWYHCEGGDCRRDNGIENIIPSSATAACGGSYADIQSTSSLTPGMVMTGGTNAILGAGQASPNPYNWLVGGTVYPETYSPASTGVIRASYEYISTRARQGGVTPTDLAPSCGAGGIANCSLSATISNGIYKASGPVTLTSGTGTYRFPTNKNFVILVDGDLTVNTKILVPNGSTATFLVNGNITFNKTIGQASSATQCVPPLVKDDYSTGCDIEGFYSADGIITIDGNGRAACATVDPTDNDLRFNFAGSMVANASLTLSGEKIVNKRDLCAGNRSCPTYAVVERPDFLLFAPDLIKFQNYIWQEIAP